MTKAPRPTHRRRAAGAFARNGRRAKAGLNRAILDASPGELRRQLAYKLAWHGGTLVVADRFFASSKTCSSCGSVKAKLSLATRTYRCDCGLEIDRDLNAALNLAAYGRTSRRREWPGDVKRAWRRAPPASAEASGEARRRHRATG